MTIERQFRMTVKQQRICDLVTLGWSSKEIAREVGVSRRTVEDHRGEIFKKVGVRNAVELTRKLFRGINMSYWAVAQTVSKMEHIARREIEKDGHGAFVPTYARHAVVDGRRQTKECPRFVGYVFFHTGGDDYAGIPDIHGVYGVLSTATGSAGKVTPEEMHRMFMTHATGDAETLPARYTKYYRPLAYLSVRRKNSRKPRPGKRIRNYSVP